MNEKITKTSGENSKRHQTEETKVIHSSHSAVKWKDTMPKIRKNIPRKGIARPQSQFPHSCVCDRLIYCQDRSAYSAAGKYVDSFWEYINRSQTHECGNWYWGRFSLQCWLQYNYLLTYDSYGPVHNRFHRGECITWASGGEGALDTPGPLNGIEPRQLHYI